MKKSLGIYIHIPFCVSKCHYCDFCSFPRKGEDVISAYADELCRRIGQVGNVSEYEVDTVYFGGGTPSLMSARDIERVLLALGNKFVLSSNAEITLEANPATADREYFGAIRSFGVNRLSMGLQSAVDRELLLLGRIHSAADFVKTYNDARAAGFDNVSADLMYGIPDQTPDTLMYSARFLADIAPDHISAYGLTVEEGTHFEKHLGELNIADGDGQSEMYMLLSDYLPSRGYNKYEISNFARDGRQSRHNLRYWKCEEYLGFGVAAHSYFGGERFGNSRDIRAFLAGDDIIAERETVDFDSARAEYVMLGLRLAAGLDLEEYSRRFGTSFPIDSPTLKAYVQAGLMRVLDGRLCFTDRGFFVSNAILGEILDLI